MTNAVFSKIDDQAMRERYALICQACESVAGEGNQQLEQQLHMYRTLSGKRINNTV